MATPLGHEYWIKRWDDGKIRWHRNHVEDIFKNHYDYLTAGVGQCSILVPLCGKSLDMKWLAEQGHSVVGIDIVELAAQQFFTENDLTFNKYAADDFLVYESSNESMKIKFLVGDVFKCSTGNTGYFDGIWDCNALVAINPQDREKYVDLLQSLLKPTGRILLSTYEYDKALRNTHPYSMPLQDIEALFTSFNVQLTETVDISERFMTNFNIPLAKRHMFYVTRK